MRHVVAESLLAYAQTLGELPGDDLIRPKDQQVVRALEQSPQVLRDASRWRLLHRRLRALTSELLRLFLQPARPMPALRSSGRLLAWPSNHPRLRAIFHERSLVFRSPVARQPVFRRGRVRRCAPKM